MHVACTRWPTRHSASPRTAHTVRCRCADRSLWCCGVLLRVQSSQTLIEWTADFSRDAPRAALADARYKATDHFKAIGTFTKSRVVSRGTSSGAVPALKRQLSTRSVALAQAFSKLDVNKNKKLEFDEFAQCVRTLVSPSLPDSAIKVLLMTADMDSDGTIDFEEFCEFLGKGDGAGAADDSKEESNKPAAGAAAAAKK
jgi:hypothetical protein